MMNKTPHTEKLLADIMNPKCKVDIPILKEAEQAYERWINNLNSIVATGEQKVMEMTRFLNEYKEYLEVEPIAR